MRHLTLTSLCSLFITFILLSCKPIVENKVLYAGNTDTLQLSFAKGFTVIKHNNYHELIVFNPWQGANNVQFHYFLSHSPGQVNRTDGIEIITPIKRVVCLSTTHIAMIDALDEVNSIVAISGANLVNNKIINEKLKNKKISDIGFENTLNYELILSLKPDIIFAFGVDTEFASYIKKLRELGLKVVFIAEYLEHEPLAKTEWIKFISYFFNKEEKASTIYDTIEKQYLRVKEISGRVSTKPKVLYGLPWNGTWYMAGGSSHAAKLIADAGGDYLWANTLSHEALPLTIESVVVKADSADIWINCGAALSKKDIIAVEKRLSQLKILQSDNIYNNSAIISSGGGNDYWESGVMNPHLILADLLAIFHPQLNSNHQLKYYVKIR